MEQKAGKRLHLSRGWKIVRNLVLLGLLAVELLLTLGLIWGLI